MLCGETSSTEFDRLAFHASLVNTVGVRLTRTPRPSRRITAATWVHLGRQGPVKPLLPNLRELHWEWTSSECCGLLYLVPSSLTHLSVRLHLDGDGMIQTQEMAALQILLSAVFTAAPIISNLALETDRFLQKSFPAAIIATLPNLRTLTMGRETMISTDAMLPLAALKELRHLVLGPVETVLPTTEDPVPSLIAFEDLETLSIGFHPQTNDMYRILSSARLAELNIVSYPIISSSSFNRTCHAWARAFPSLRTIDCRFVVVDSPEQREALSRVISPLFAIPTIRSVRLRLAHRQYTVGDSDVHDIAMAWSGLVMFEISLPGMRTADSEGLGLASLLDLALHCPKLTKLRLPRFTISAVVLENIDNYPVLDHGLQELNFDRLGVEFDQYSLGALLLDRLFPHLQLEVRKDAVESQGGWERLQFSLWLCQRARRQQELRAGSRGARE